MKFPTSGARLGQLDALRGLAALSVVFSHYFLLLHGAPKSAAEAAAVNAVAWSPLALFFTGHQAVLLFFVLSGMALTYMLGSVSSYGVYLYRRVCRLYLPYIVTVLVAVLANALFFREPILAFGDWFGSVWTGEITVPSVVHHALFIGRFEVSQYNYALWSLVHEMRISLVFPLLLAWMVRTTWRRSLGALALLSAAASVGYFLTIHRLEWVADLLLTLHYLLFFGVGVLLVRHREALGRWYGARSRRQRGGLLLVGLLLYTYGNLADRLGVGNPLALDWPALPGVVLIVLAALHSATVKAALLRPLPQFLGRISYSLYLIHPVVQLSAVHALQDVLSPAVAALVGLALTIPVAMLLYTAVEEPAMRLGRRLRDRRPQGRAEAT